ncbi:MAG: hypothetical protein RR547_10000, partial [Raoultibacter sp.]
EPAVLTFAPGSPSSGVGYTWDGEGTLTIDNLDLSATSQHGIKLTSNATIIVLGTNTITLSVDAAATEALEGICSSTGDLSIIGDGSLTIRTNLTQDPKDITVPLLGISADTGHLTIGKAQAGGPTLNVTATQCSIYAESGIDIFKSNVTTHTLGAEGGSYGIYASNGSIAINDAEITNTVTGFDITNCGILAQGGNLTITGGSADVRTSVSDPSAADVSLMSNNGNIILDGITLNAAASESGAALQAKTANTGPGQGSIQATASTIKVSGEIGLEAMRGITLDQSRVTGSTVERFMWSSNMPITIAASTVDGTSTGGFMTSGILSWSGIDIVNSTVTMIATGEASRGIVSSVDPLSITNSTVIAQGTEAGIGATVNRLAPSDPAYIVLGSNMAISEGGSISHYVETLPDQVTSFWSFSPTGLFEVVDGHYTGVSNRVVLQPENPVPPTPPTPVPPEPQPLPNPSPNPSPSPAAQSLAATGDTMPLMPIGLLAAGAGLLLVCVFLSYKAHTKAINKQK